MNDVYQHQYYSSETFDRWTSQQHDRDGRDTAANVAMANTMHCTLTGVVVARRT